MSCPVGENLANEVGGAGTFFMNVSFVECDSFSFGAVLMLSGFGLAVPLWELCADLNVFHECREEDHVMQRYRGGIVREWHRSLELGHTPQQQACFTNLISRREVFFQSVDDHLDTRLDTHLVPGHLHGCNMCHPFVQQSDEAHRDRKIRQWQEVERRGHVKRIEHGKRHA